MKFCFDDVRHFVILLFLFCITLWIIFIVLMYCYWNVSICRIIGGARGIISIATWETNMIHSMMPRLKTWCEQFCVELPENNILQNDDNHCNKSPSQKWVTLTLEHVENKISCTDVWKICEEQTCKQCRKLKHITHIIAYNSKIIKTKSKQHNQIFKKQWKHYKLILALTSTYVVVANKKWCGSILVRSYISKIQLFVAMIAIDIYQNKSIYDIKI